MSTYSKEKGSRAETAAKELLKKHTGYNWERTPLSGALDAKHGLSGDLYIPKKRNKYTVEVKHYAESGISHLLISGKTPIIKSWWEQVIREAKENENLPLLIFKHDRSKFYVATNIFDEENYNKLIIKRSDFKLQVSLLEDWLINTKPEFV